MKAVAKQEKGSKADEGCGEAGKGGAKRMKAVAKQEKGSKVDEGRGKAGGRESEGWII